MDMVRDAADGFGNAVELPYDAAEEGMKPIPPCGHDHSDAVFGAEDEMIVERKMSGWHGARILRRPSRGAHLFWAVSGGLRHRLMSAGPPGQRLSRQAALPKEM